MRYLTPDQFGARMAAIAKALKENVRTGQAEILTETQQEFVKRSSGTLTSGVLRKMGHPYATRSPQTPVDPSIVNDQGGGVRRGWRKAGPRFQNGAYRGSVTNSDPNAQFLLGTKRMVKRPIDTYVAGVMRPKFRNRMRAALREGLKA